jgi:Z1 domain
MIQQALKTIRTLLPTNTSVTKEEIEKAVDMALMIPHYADLQKDALIREIQCIYNIRQDDFTVIENKRIPWISEKKGSIKWDFWNRYRDYLTVENNFSETVMNHLDRLTDRTLDGLFDPSVNASISKYGLVVGQVQSGKTSNYTGLICKAADAGYKLIIVLAGVLDNLRSQTQLRLDEGFLGFDTQHQRAFDQNNLWIGVGKLGQNNIAHSLTSSLDKGGDFTKGAANSFGMHFNTSDPIIAVVKKNTKVLARLFRWLSANGVDVDGKRLIRNKSLLLIDDEADNASINTNKENDPATKTNRQIRDILGLFERSGYVGYTATPFANIFIPIEEDDLFPQDFIVNIPPPSNYIGPEKVFGFDLVEDDEVSETVLPIVRRIDDFNSFVPNGHKINDSLPSEAPESLKLAIKSFIVTCAIRRLRGQEKVHNSMLVHVTRFVRWQKKIKEIVENVFSFYKRGIEMKIPSILEEIRQVFEVDAENYVSYVTTSQNIINTELHNIDSKIQVHQWSDILVHLNEAASRIQVLEINGGSSDALTYFNHKNGLSVIAIGGDKLSRGLTLEGLSVSYYLRPSKMYDTLMQMGRWFGYRLGYVDLCRLFTSRELNEWFCHIAVASEELRDEFDYMSDIAGSTPKDYALRVKTHPGVLQISASNKIRRAEEVRVSWSGRLVESYELSKNPTAIEKNLNAAIHFIEGIEDKFEREDNYYLAKNVSFELIKQFFLGFEVYDNLKSAAPNNLLHFIEFKYRKGELNNWNIGIITKSNGEPFKVTEKIELKLLKRQESGDSEGQPYYLIRKAHIIGPKDEFIDLTEEERKEADIETARLWKDKKKDGEPKYPNGNWVRNNTRKKANKCLLLIYFLDPEPAGLLKDSKPIVGFAISFPGTDRDDAVGYAVHKQLLPIFNQEDVYDLDEYDED